MEAVVWMEWLTYLIYGLLLWFVVSRFLPLRWLEQLGPQDVEERLKDKKQHVYLDVREPGEYKGGHIPGFTNIPLSQLKRRVGEVEKGKTVILTCQSGMRSRQAAKILRKYGCTRIAHLKTGMSGWRGRVVR